jgi:group II intron reverse transcriptase/maturase
MTTWETLSFPGNGYALQAITKQGKQTQDRESDNCVVLLRLGNARRKKAVTCLRPLLRETIAMHSNGLQLETKLAMIAKVAKEKPKEKFTSLVHLLNVDMLMKCHHELKRNKAYGIDKVTKDAYEENLIENIKRLQESIKNMTYKPKPVQRVYIPKPGSSKKRPLGISSYEDKIIQLAVSKILTSIYEQDFLECSYGFRPNRGCHDALRDLTATIITKKVNWIVDADIQCFFDHVDHTWMMKCLEVRIKDRNLLRLIVRMLKVGTMEEGKVKLSSQGTPQGSIVFTVLANIYLHYVLDRWFEKFIKKHCQGYAHLVRYADDYVCCFQYKSEAEDFFQRMVMRLRTFNLDISSEKSKIIEFGRFAAHDRKRRGENKPETFDFLGFTLYCSKSKHDKFRVKCKTSRKKFKASIYQMKQWIKSKRTTPVKQIMIELKPKLIGYYRYYGITDNTRMIVRYHCEIKRVLFKWLNRRSQRLSYNWSKFQLFLTANPLPEPKIYVSICKSR